MNSLIIKKKYRHFSQPLTLKQQYYILLQLFIGHNNNIIRSNTFFLLRTIQVLRTYLVTTGNNDLAFHPARKKIVSRRERGDHTRILTGRQSSVVIIARYWQTPIGNTSTRTRTRTCTRTSTRYSQEQLRIHSISTIHSLFFLSSVGNHPRIIA